MVLLSIIMPVYNAEKTIKKTVSSLAIIQNKNLVELIAVDDGSIDRGIKILNEQKNALSLGRFELLTQKNSGTSSARNRGLEAAKGEWVMFLDADDELRFDCPEYIQKNNNYDALGFQTVFYKNGQSCGSMPALNITPHNFLDILTAKNPFQPSNIIFKKKILQKNFNESFPYMEDWLFWIDNPSLFKNIKYFPNTISAIINIHGANKSADYKKHGEYRKKVAQTVLSNMSGELTKKQINNLRVQEVIGDIMRGEKINWLSLFFVPCSIILYFKFLVYLFTKGRYQKYNLYTSQ